MADMVAGRAHRLLPNRIRPKEWIPTMNETAWSVLKAEQANLQPTPPIGTPVQWYKGGSLNEVRAAQVTAIEGPGRVVVCINEPAAFPKTMKGVFHASHRIHKQTNNATTVRCGSWDYLPITEIPDSHYDLHRAELKKRSDNLRRIEEEAKAIKVEEPAVADETPKAKGKTRKDLEPTSF